MVMIIVATAVHGPLGPWRPLIHVIKSLWRRADLTLASNGLASYLRLAAMQEASLATW
jgi:hypothetical protein